MIADEIIKIATAYAYAGIKEIEPNQGFTDKNYQKDILGVGWYPSAEWCAFSAILDWKKGYVNNPEIWAKFNLLKSGNSQEMLKNCRRDVFWPTGEIPRPGCIVIWQNGNSFVSGHAGVCIGVNGNHFTTVEGNTIPAGNPGNEREGYTIAVHVHTLGLPHVQSGLNYDRSIYVVENL